MRDDIAKMDSYERSSSASYDLPAAISDIGCERDINEDRYACFSFGDSSVWLVCDGMGGAVGGELAAQLAIDTIKKVLENDPLGISHELVAHAFTEANRVVVLRRQNPAFAGMGTTIVGAVITPHYLSIFHAGDSRAYVVQADEMQQITTDHTYVQDLVSRGMISENEALHHPQSHVLTRCLGGQLKLDYDSSQFGITPVEDKGAVLVLCSDGLYSLISDNEIKQHVSSFSPQSACSKLIELARARGGFDNITVAVVPLGSQVNLSGEYELPQEMLKKSKRPAQVLTREAPQIIREKSFSQKLALLVLLGVLSGVSLILAVIFL